MCLALMFLLQPKNGSELQRGRVSFLLIARGRQMPPVPTVTTVGAAVGSKTLRLFLWLS